MLTKRKKQDVWLTQEQYDALQTLEDGVEYHITNAKVDYSTEVSNRPILNTNNTTAQSTSANETITGTINLHKVAKTGTSTDLTDSNDLVRSSAFSTLQGKVTTIESEIPSEASSSNQLADKNFVNSSINSISAYYITRNAAGDPFGTKAQLTGASTFYSGGSVRVPTKNDYCVVLADESQGTTVSGYTSFTTTAQYVGYFVIYNNEGIEVTSSNKDSVGITAGTTVAYEDLPTTRYIYQGTQWDFQYKVNDTPLTAQQLSTLNSGFTASDKATFDNMVNDLQNKAEKDASNLSSSNVTSWKNRLNFESIDLLYDKDNADSSINWGYTSGISPNTSKTIDLTKYKRLRGYALVGYKVLVYEVDLEHLTWGSDYNGGGCFPLNDTSGLGALILWANISVNSAKSQLTCKSGFHRLSDNSMTDTYTTIKIEGVY